MDLSGLYINKDRTLCGCCDHGNWSKRGNENKNKETVSNSVQSCLKYIIKTICTIEFYILTNFITLKSLYCLEEIALSDKAAHCTIIF